MYVADGPGCIGRRERLRSPGGHEPNWKQPRIGVTSYKKHDRLFRSCSLPCKQAKHRYTSLCLVHVCTVRSNVQFVCFAAGSACFVFLDAQRSMRCHRVSGC